MKVYVGIGTSAGGVEALQTLFANMPPASDIVFFVVQHLLPNTETMMDKILQKVTPMPVHLVSDGMIPEGGHVYLNVPDKLMVLRDGLIRLEDISSNEEKYSPINQFLQSMCGDDSVSAGAVILTGSGSDGLMGASAVKNVGGFVIVQDPSEAQYSSMPQSVIAAELADVQLPLDQIGKAIEDYVNDPAKYYVKNEESLLNLLQTEDFRTIVSGVNEFSGIDFWYYKAHSVVRRIEQRVAMNKLANIHEYVELFTKSQEEKKMLCKSLLVGVTSFFRDKEAFKQLEKKVILPLVKRKSADGVQEQLRVWCVACSTGEEVYSIAILILKCMESAGVSLDVKIFATDVDADSVAFAQKGLYSPVSVKSVPPSLVRKYFTKKEEGYVVKEAVRRMVVFARHNIFSDPPFSNLDLISCRNMLIYIRPEKQYSIFSIFFQMLSPPGFLFLGSSESLGMMEQSFDIVERKWKIFQKKDMPAAFPLGEENVGHMPETESLYDSRILMSPSSAPSQRALSSLKNQRQSAFTNEIVQKLFAVFAGPSIIVDSNNVVVHVFDGGGKFLKIQNGIFNDTLYKFFPKEVSGFVSFFINELTTRNETYCEQKISGLEEYPDETLVLRIHRLNVEGQNFFLIRLDSQENVTSETPEESGESVRAEHFRSKRIQMLENELSRLQYQLKQALAESDRKNEELQSTNEELLASNEELQSTNEEMSSVNAELFTVNAEYQNKISELTTANADFDNLLVNGEVGALYIDENMDIRKITPIMLKKSNLRVTDVGRPINEINFMYSYPNFIHDVEKVFEEDSIIEKCVTEADDSMWLIRIRPYYWSDNRVRGVLVTIFDITKQLHVAQVQINTIVDSVPGGVLHLNFTSRFVIDYANKGFYAMSGYTAEEIKEHFQNRFDRLIVQKDRVKFNAEIANIDKHNPVIRFECRMLCKNGNIIWISIQASVMMEDEKIGLYCTVLDISEIKNYEEQLLREKAYYDVLYQNVVCGIVQYEKSDNTLRCYNANDEAVRMLGFKNLDEFRLQDKQTLGSVSTGGAASDVIHRMLALSEVGEGMSFEHQVTRTDGTVGWVRGYAKVIVTSDGKQLIQSTFLDVTKEKESLQVIEQERREYEALYKILYNTAVCGIIQFDMYRQKILNANREATNILRASQEEIREAVFCDLPEEAEAVLPLSELNRLLQSVSAVSNPMKNEMQVTLRDGVRITIQYSVDGINLNNNSKIIQLTFIDVTGERQLKDTEMRLQITERTSKAKSQFLSKMSHEIRTPMNAIVGMIEILRMTSGNKEAFLDCLDKMTRSMRHLKLLVSDVLDMSKIESGKMQLEYVNADLNVLLKEIFDEFSFEANGKQVTLNFENTIRHGSVQIDTIRFREVIGNLLSNAIKFTEPGGTVSLSAAEQEQSDGKSLYTFRIKDTGCGISKKNLNVIFDAFEQGHDKKTYGKPGSGLGLSICKSLVEMMGGKLEVFSEEGKGSEFFFSVPLSCLDCDCESSESEQDYTGKFSGVKVLLAEDNDLNREIAKTLLEGYEFIVEDTVNGEELINRYLSKPDNYFDLVIVDIQMPVLDGLETARKLRQCDKPDAKTIPIVAMSANTFEEDVKASFDAGMNAHIAKPIDIKFLLKSIADLLSSPDSEGDNSVPPPTGKTGAE